MEDNVFHCSDRGDHEEGATFPVFVAAAGFAVVKDFCQLAWQQVQHQT